MDEHEKKLRENLRQAEYRVQHAVCPIYGVDGRDRPQLIGSSILLKLRSSSFLVTAAHVLDKNKETTLYVGGATRLVPLQGSSLRTRPPTSGRGYDTFDIGFIDISETTPNQWSRYRFLTPGDFDVDDVPAAHTLYGFVGFPETRNRPLPDHKLKLSTTVFVVVASALERYDPSGLNPLAHFLGEFDRKKQVDAEKGLVTAPDPHGISGGSVWRLGRPDELATGAPAERLIGIGIEYRRPEKVLVGARISLVVAALGKAYPGSPLNSPNLNASARTSVFPKTIRR
jgi:hypothetical protein